MGKSYAVESSSGCDLIKYPCVEIIDIQYWSCSEVIIKAVVLQAEEKYDWKRPLLERSCWFVTVGGASPDIIIVEVRDFTPKPSKVYVRCRHFCPFPKCGKIIACFSPPRRCQVKGSSLSVFMEPCKIEIPYESDSCSEDEEDTCSEISLEEPTEPIVEIKSDPLKMAYPFVIVILCLYWLKSFTL